GGAAHRPRRATTACEALPGGCRRLRVGCLLLRGREEAFRLRFPVGGLRSPVVTVLPQVCNDGAQLGNQLIRGDVALLRGEVVGCDFERRGDAVELGGGGLSFARLGAEGGERCGRDV